LRDAIAGVAFSGYGDLPLLGPEPECGPIESNDGGGLASVPDLPVSFLADVE